MKLFSIDRENNITAFAKRKDAEAANREAFRSQTELSDLAAAWPGSRLLQILTVVSAKGEDGQRRYSVAA